MTYLALDYAFQLEHARYQVQHDYESVVWHLEQWTMLDRPGSNVVLQGQYPRQSNINYVNFFTVLTLPRPQAPCPWVFITALEKNPQESYVQVLDELYTRNFTKSRLSCNMTLCMA
jgi:hypothetical protein